MIVRINVTIEAEPKDASHGYGQMNFNESASLNDTSFDTISRVFTRAHELIDDLKKENKK